MTNILQRPLNARVAPVRIFRCHPNHEAPNLGEHSRSPRLPAGVRPFPRNQFAMPPEDLFVLELPSRRVHVSESTPYPDETFVVQALRELANAIDGVLVDGCLLICDLDRKWSRGVLAFLEDEGVRIIQRPFRAPYYNAYAERFVRSIKEEYLERMILFGERHLRRTIAEFVAPLPC
jgi:hypothetical protein